MGVDVASTESTSDVVCLSKESDEILIFQRIFFLVEKFNATIPLEAWLTFDDSDTSVDSVTIDLATV